MSIFDEIDKAHEEYLRRHRKIEKLVDDADPSSREPNEKEKDD